MAGSDTPRSVTLSSPSCQRFDYIIIGIDSTSKRVSRKVFSSVQFENSILGYFKGTLRRHCRLRVGYEGS